MIGLSPVTHQREFIGILVFMELHNRIHKGKFGKVPRALSDDAFKIGGYCIDAPDSLPAGGMVSMQLDETTWCPTQITSEREE